MYFVKIKNLLFNSLKRRRYSPAGAEEEEVCLPVVDPLEKTKNWLILDESNRGECLLPLRPSLGKIEYDACHHK